MTDNKHLTHDETIFRGNVTEFREINDLNRADKIWQFILLQEHKESGEKRLLPVKIQALEFNGILRNNDVVRISGHIKDGNLIPEEIINETLSESRIEIQKGFIREAAASKPLRKAFIAWLSIPLIIFFIFVVIFILVLTQILNA